MSHPIHFSVSGLFGFATSTRIAACSARVDRWWTQDGEGEGALGSVTCGNCLRTKAYKGALKGEPVAPKVPCLADALKGSR